MADFAARYRRKKGLSDSDDDDSSHDEEKKKYNDDSDEDDDGSSNDGEKRKHEDDDIDGVEIDDPSTKKQKISMGFNKTFGSLHSVKASEKKNVVPITMKLGVQKPKESKPSLKKASTSVASVFNQDSDEEEMPPEAKMRMRNIGRDTPTSAGPNSFGKTRQGFCDSKKVFERQLKEKMEEVSDK